MKTINVTDKATLDKLYEGSALTLEGLAEASIPDFFDWIKKLTPLKEETAYIIKGGVMNKTYGLTGTNAYPDDLTIVSVELDTMENYGKVILPRFEIGARWFDDIVDNNARREGYDD